MLIITIVTSLKNYKQKQMKSEIVRKHSTLHDNVFWCAIRTPPCGLSFLSVSGLNKIDQLGLFGFQ